MQKHMQKRERTYMQAHMQYMHCHNLERNDYDCLRMIRQNRQYAT